MWVSVYEWVRVYVRVYEWVSVYEWVRVYVRVYVCVSEWVSVWMSEIYLFPLLMTLTNTLLHFFTRVLVGGTCPAKMKGAGGVSLTHSLTHTLYAHLYR
jgi:hypothetical protein